MKEKPPPTVGLAAHGIQLADELVVVGTHEVRDLVRDEFVQQGETVPDDAQVAALSCVVAGYLRTSPLQHGQSPEGQLMVAASFVATCADWWTHDLGDAGELSRLLGDVLRRSPVPAPEQAGMHMLVALGVGTLHATGLAAPAPAAHRAIAGWIAALYAGGAEDWQ